MNVKLRFNFEALHPIKPYIFIIFEIINMKVEHIVDITIYN